MRGSRPRLSGRAKPDSLAGDTEVFLARVDNQPMKTLTITAARRRFGAMLDAVQREPVLIRRRNRDEVVIMSAEQYDRMTGTTGPEPELANLRRRMTNSSKSR